MYIAEYGIKETAQPNGMQLWLVGIDSAVYTTWQSRSTSNFGPWTSLGGIARSGVKVETNGRWTKLEVLGADAARYCKDFNLHLASAWWPSMTTWARCT
jgi:hypothetical protein